MNTASVYFHLEFFDLKYYISIYMDEAKNFIMKNASILFVNFKKPIKDQGVEILDEADKENPGKFKAIVTGKRFSIDWNWKDNFPYKASDLKLKKD